MLVPFIEILQNIFLKPIRVLIFWRTRRYKSIYNLKIDTNEMLIHDLIEASFVSFKTIYDMSCHLLTES
jgi:hypothetical protein